MSQRKFQRLIPLALAAAVCIPLSVVKAGDPDPAIMTFRLPKDIKWDNAKKSGNQAIVLFGDPNKPGEEYGIIQKWLPHSMSRPHFHQNDRNIYVVSGTWWVGWGPKYDPDSTYPMPAGSFVKHIGKQLHYDGAKDEECVLYITGIGPASSTNGEQK